MKISRTNRFGKKSTISKSKKSLLERNVGTVNKNAGNQVQSSSPSVSLSSKGSFIASLQQELSSTPAVRLDMIEQAKQDISSGQLGNGDDTTQAVTAIIIEL